MDWAEIAWTLAMPPDLGGRGLGAFAIEKLTYWQLTMLSLDYSKGAPKTGREGERIADPKAVELRREAMRQRRLKYTGKASREEL